MKHLDELLLYAREHKVSDIHITHTESIYLRKNGSILPSDKSFELNRIWHDLLGELSTVQNDNLNDLKDVDFCYELPNHYRHRVNIFRQQGSLCSAIRILNEKIPSFEELNLPEVFKTLASNPRGLILVTGPTGSGKSTTLAAMIDYINATRKSHIITIEDPVEYKYFNKNSIIHQRELGVDTSSFAHALKGILRQDPDIILVGEMRDPETISAAITAAETGHLVLSTLHTVGAANTIDRIIDAFPGENQNQIRSQLSGILKGVITQQLLPLANGAGRCAAFEILIGTDAVLNLIRENKTHQINAMLQTGAKEGMNTLESNLASLVRMGKISVDTATEAATVPKELFRYLQR